MFSRLVGRVAAWIMQAMNQEPAKPSSSPYAPSSKKPHEVVNGSRSLWRDPSFLGLTGSQFLGAFNDNLFKQLLLLLAIPAVAGMPDQQDVATMVFSAPFVLFSGIAGHLADRYSKTRIIVWSKSAEIVAMLLGMAAFLAFRVTGYNGLLVVLFLMGLHSTFFGPGKYGILPELFTLRDLPRANGIILMTTFLAIIFGTVTAGILSQTMIDNSRPLEETATGLWRGSAICLLIAVIGTVMTWAIRFVQPAEPGLRMSFDCWTIPRETRAYLRSDTPLVGAIIVSSVFWLVSGIAIQAVNSLGKVQLQLTDALTSVMTACIGLGIAIGAVLAGKLSAGRANPRVILAGLWGIALTLVLLSISWREPAASGEATSYVYRHLLGFRGALPVLAILGVSAGFFAIPLQVFIQSRPPESQKGRMVAVMNQANFLAILLSGACYKFMSTMTLQRGWPRSFIFAMMACLVVPLLIFYRPHFDESPDDSRTHAS